MTSRLQRIVFLLPSFAGGGAERVVLTLIKALGPQFDCCLLVLDGCGPLRGDVPRNVRLIDLGRRRLRNALMPLFRQIRAQRPDVIVSTMGYMNLATLALGRVWPGSCRIVIREANLPEATLRAFPIPLIGTLAYRVLYRWAAVVLCPSQAVKAALNVKCGIPDSRLIYMPNPVDQSHVRNCAYPSIRHPGRGPRFVAAGRLTAQKGWDRLIESIAALPESGAHLTVLGDGPERQILRERIAALGLDNSVTLLGFVRNPWPYYAGADAFVMTSRWEGMPNACLEALAVGTPVIATPESGGIAEVAEETQQGAVTIAKAGTELVAAMARVKPATTESGQVRESLLPCRYDVATVAARFSELLGTP